MSVRINLEIGHEASIRTKRTQEGFTHDWEVFVRGCDGAEIHNYIEKVVFHLHETFLKPKRVIKEPPYSVKESGYAGFNLPIDIYLRNKDEPKKVKFNYDLHLQPSGPAIMKVQKEKYVFHNPNEEFKHVLLKGGGSNVTSSSIDPIMDSKSSYEEKTQLLNKPKLGGGSDVLKKYKKMDEPRGGTDSFHGLFGIPIRKTTKISPDPKPVSKDVNKSNSSNKEKEKEKDRSKNKSPSKDKDRDRDKSKEKGGDSERKSKDKDKEKTKDRNKEREKSKDKSSKRNKSPRPRSPSPKRVASPKRPVSPKRPPSPPPPPPPIPKHKEVEKRGGGGDVPKEKEKKSEDLKKYKKEKREKEREYSKDSNKNEYKEHKSKEQKPKEVIREPELMKMEKKPKEKDAGKEPEKVEERKEKHKHKKKDKEKREKKDKEEKHKLEKKLEKAPPQQQNNTNAAKYEPKELTKEPEKSIFASPKHEEPKKHIKPLNTLFSEIENENSNSSASSKDDYHPPPPVPPPPIEKSEPEPEPLFTAAVKKPETEKVKVKKEKAKKKEKRADKEEKKRKRRSDTKAEEEPEPKLPKDEHFSDQEQNVSQPPNKELDKENQENPEEYMKILRELQHKIMTLQDNSELQKVVQLIAETGRYEVSARTFDFDLCLLERSTVRRLQEFFSISS